MYVPPTDGVVTTANGSRGERGGELRGAERPCAVASSMCCAKTLTVFL